MKTSKTIKDKSAIWKTAVCIGLSTFYFAMLAYPFGVTAKGFALEKMVIAAVIFFAISIPAWIINVKREFFTEENETAGAEAKAAVAPRSDVTRIGQLARLNQWLSPKEVKQVLFCQDCDGKKFGEVAVKRNFLTLTQVKSLLKMQQDQRQTVAPSHVVSKQ